MGLAYNFHPSKPPERRLLYTLISIRLAFRVQAGYLSAIEWIARASRATGPEKVKCISENESLGRKLLRTERLG